MKNCLQGVKKTDTMTSDLAVRMSIAAGVIVLSIALARIIKVAFIWSKIRSIPGKRHRYVTDASGSEADVSYRPRAHLPFSTGLCMCAGPPADSFILGNVGESRSPDRHGANTKLSEKYGATLRRRTLDQHVCLLPILQPIHLHLRGLQSYALMTVICAIDN